MVANGDLREEIAAVRLLVNTPTARLERLFAEHMDTCSYRLGAGSKRWYVISLQLCAVGITTAERMKGGVPGMYGWLENEAWKTKLTTLEPADDLKPILTLSRRVTSRDPSPLGATAKLGDTFTRRP
jgi:hypothetical protein